MTKYTFKSQFATQIEHIKPKLSRPTILYLHGFCSDCWGAKPEAVKEFCLEHGVGLLRFEYAGHGSDEQNFEKADFCVWKEQVFEAVEDMIKGDIVAVGSSMGGWLSLLAAEKYPERIKGVIGLAAAPNFVTKFMNVFSEEDIAKIYNDGKLVVAMKDFSYTITKKFVETAMQSCLPENEGEKWQINCPVHLIQGMQDDSVLWQRAIEIGEYLSSDSVVVKLLKNSNHRLNADEDIAELRNSLVNVVNI